MRIRQVKPAFWTDATLARVSYPARLFYIGLWNIADDGGWLQWEPSGIGALLYPFETPKRRERLLSDWSDELVREGRLTIHECGCASIPTLPKHQRIQGVQSFTVRDKHQREHVSRLPLSATQSPLSHSPVLGSVGSGEDRKGNGGGVGGPLPVPETTGQKTNGTTTKRRRLPADEQMIADSQRILADPASPEWLRLEAEKQLDGLGVHDASA